MEEDSDEDLLEKSVSEDDDDKPKDKKRSESTESSNDSDDEEIVKPSKKRKHSKKSKEVKIISPEKSKPRSKRIPRRNDEPRNSTTFNQCDWPPGYSAEALDSMSQEVFVALMESTQEEVGR